MLLDAGYKWNAVDVLPVVLLPPADILLAVAKGDEEELTDKLTNLKVSGNDADEEGGDKK